MGGTYEYLMSSLPHLTFRNTAAAQQEVLGLLRKYAGALAEGQSAAILLDGEARKFLPPKAFALFQKVNLHELHEAAFQTGTSKVLAAFSRFTLELKNDMRSIRTGESKTSEQQKIADILGTGTPLEKEVRLMQYQWQRLEDLAQGHYADLEAIFAYKIKLLLLERWWSFEAEQGWTRFSELTATS